MFNNRPYHFKAAFVILLNTILVNVFAQKPVTYLTDPARLVSIQQSIKNNNAHADNLKQLVKQADKLLTKKILSVVDKNFEVPCGNKHEYVSLARYYWPDPTKPDGKPYIKKDGQKNPDNDKITDDKSFDDIISSVNTLSYTYYFTGDEKYATKSIELLRFWFLDTATLMLPNLNHSQMITGKDTGQQSGIIDTHNLPKVIDAVGLLGSSKSWTAKDQAGMKQWFANYVEWMLTSKNGMKESKAKNNHGTFYDMQIASEALFSGQNKMAEVVLKGEIDRIASQIEPDGKQPLELERTLALGYSTFNLEAWFMLANIAERRGIDLWHYQTSDGRSLKKALDWLLPYAVGEKKWEYQQINPYKTQDFYPLLLQAAIIYKDNSYLAKAELIKDTNKNVLVKILYE